MNIARITDTVFTCTEYEGGNVTCINTEKGAVLIDTPMRPRDIDHWQAQVMAANPRGVKYIIATHQHFDHIIGNHQLGGEVIMHADAAADMLIDGATLREDMVPLLPGLTAAEADLILNETLVMPDLTFEETLTLNFDETVIELVAAGGHTAGSTCVYLPQEKILITGDVLTAARHPYKGQADFAEWIEALFWMRDLEVGRIVPGHGDVCRSEEIDRFIEYFTRMWLLTESQIMQGKSRRDIIRTVHDNLFPFFEVEPERLEGARMTFDLGTSLLYDEILGNLDF